MYRLIKMFTETSGSAASGAARRQNSGPPRKQPSGPTARAEEREALSGEEEAGRGGGPAPWSATCRRRPPQHSVVIYLLMYIYTYI